MEAHAHDRKLKWLFWFHVLFFFALLGFFAALSAFEGGPPGGRLRSLAIYLGLFSIATAITYGTAVRGRRQAAAKAHERGASPSEALGDSLGAFGGVGFFLAAYPNLALLSAGWLWSLPLYGFYCFYLCQLYLLWRRYQDALAAQG